MTMVVSTTSCWKKISREGIYLQNNYDDTIFALVAWNGMEHIYPDTALPQTKPKFGTGEVPPGEKSTIKSTGMGGNWSDIINSLPADTLSIYLFAGKTLSTYNWSQIRDRYLILKRYDLSLQDLKIRNFTITYP